MAPDFPRSHYSKTEIARAGEILSAPMPYHPDLTEKYAHVFKIAYDFRDSHAYPMRRLRQDLAGRIKRAKARGLTAARTKRMESIRKKLSRIKSTLTQIEDLGGCRAIIESMEGLRRTLDSYRQSTGPHKIRKDRSYIDHPKEGGYRSHHLVFEFSAGEQGDAPFDGRRIEIQLRTRLQHSWATAVEAVGLLNNQDLKAGEGDTNWLRLFELVSSEFAEAENSPCVPGTHDRPMRLAEIRDLEQRLGALWFIKHWNLAIHETETLIAPGSKYYLLQYQNSPAGGSTIGVRGFRFFEEGAAEEQRERGTVVVEVDKVENLREAYPNYFLDMSLFHKNLGLIVEGKSVRSSFFEDAPRTEERPLVRGINTSNLSWLRNWRKK